MRYFGTNFSLTLGAWRLRVAIDLEDAPDGEAPALRMPPLPNYPERERIT